MTGPLREHRVKYRRPHGTRLGGAAPRPGDGHDRRPRHRDAPARRWQERDEEGRTLRRTLGIANLGGATLDNEENYLIKKLLTGARRRPGREPGAHMTLLHRPRSGDVVRAGRGHDLPAGPAERRLHPDHGLEHGRGHPVGFQWVMEARERGAEVIHVDPRFTRTSALADSLRAAPGRHRHRLPRRHRQLHPRARPRVPRVRASATRTRP